MVPVIGPFGLIVLVEPLMGVLVAAFAVGLVSLVIGLFGLRTQPTPMPTPEPHPGYPVRLSRSEARF